MTIVELMISMALGIFVILVATSLLLSTKSGYTTQEEITRIQDTGRFAMENISRAVHQAGYENWDKNDAPFAATVSASASINGLDSHTLKSTTAELDSPSPKSINGSDVLAIRFFGAGKDALGDGTVLNCAGFSQPAPTSQETANEDRGWSIFYVAADSTGEPELRCKYRGKNSWSSAAIARGVESFQVLYGLDIDGDGAPNSYLTATELNALDDALVLAAVDGTGGESDKNKRTHWKKIVSLKIALLLRSTQNIPENALPTQYDLFGKDYGDMHAATDSGTRIRIEELPNSTRSRIRKAFLLTVRLRNQSAGSEA